MTKPIEGWVNTMGGDGPLQILLNTDAESGLVVKGEQPIYYTELFFQLPKPNIGDVFRPVRITFTDEEKDPYESISRPNHLTTHAIKAIAKQEERERILKEIRQIIFGEQK